MLRVALKGEKAVEQVKRGKKVYKDVIIVLRVKNKL